MTEKLRTLDHAQDEAVFSLTLQVVMDHTGYARDMLSAEAEFETDLGIDSIVQLEIFVDLLARCGLPEHGVSWSGVQSIADLAAKLATLLDGKPLPAQAEQAAEPEAALADGLLDEILRAPHAAPTEALRHPPTLQGRTMRDFVDLPDRDLFHKTRAFQAFYAEQRAAGYYWYGMPLEGPCQNRALIHDEVAGRRREFLMFASNNYLGLANDPRVIAAISEAAGRYGATNTGCRLIGGSNVLHKELERKLAKLKGAEDSIVFPSGYSANVGTISALMSSRDVVFTDALNHMSIQDGCKLAGAPSASTSTA
jgi:glycine C-acetyltransferase